LGSLPTTETNFNYKGLNYPYEIIGHWPYFPRTKTEKGYLSANDLNTITKLGIPSEYTEVFTNDKIPNYTVTENQLAAMKYGSAGPVADAEEYEDIKKRADKTAKKKLTFRDLVLKSKGIE
jgi:thioredoxin-related protein